MSGKEKGRLAAAVVDQHCAFEEALAGNRKRYPRLEFRSFAKVIRRYVQATRKDEMLHRNVVQASVREFLDAAGAFEAVIVFVVLGAGVAGQARMGVAMEVRIEAMKFKRHCQPVEVAADIPRAKPG